MRRGHHDGMAGGLPVYQSVVRGLPNACVAGATGVQLGLRPRTLRDVSETLIGHVQDTNWSMELADVTDLSVTK